MWGVWGGPTHHPGPHHPISHFPPSFSPPSHLHLAGHEAQELGEVDDAVAVGVDLVDHVLGRGVCVFGGGFVSFRSSGEEGGGRARSNRSLSLSVAAAASGGPAARASASLPRPPGSGQVPAWTWPGTAGQVVPVPSRRAPPPRTREEAEKKLRSNGAPRPPSPSLPRSSLLSFTCSSASVGFWPRDRMTVPSSLVVMVPSPSLSKRANASCE